LSFSALGDEGDALALQWCCPVGRFLVSLLPVGVPFTHPYTWGGEAAKNSTYSAPLRENRELQTVGFLTFRFNISFALKSTKDFFAGNSAKMSDFATC